MRRAPVVLAATAAGLAATLSFHAHAPAQQTVAAARTAAAPAGGSGSRTITGAAVDTRYGPVQVEVTVAGGKVTDVQALQLPQSDPRSSQISAYAAPLLRQSALAARSASIDAVSGATYTSGGYAQSLQSALGQAGLA